MTGDGTPRVSRRRIALRRGVVLGLLLICVVLFTTFFREGDSGFLHRAKGTVTAVVAPVQDGAVAAIQPFKDGWNWFADLRGARAERDALRLENAALSERLAKAQAGAVNEAEFRKALRLTELGPEGYRAIPAGVTVRSQFDYYKRVTVDRGSSHGVTKNSLVFVPGDRNAAVYPALIGYVSSVQARSAEITFITDPNSSVAAKTAGALNNLGLLRAGTAGKLRLEEVPADQAVVEGDVVVTTGAGTDTLPSIYPADVPLGIVTSVSASEPDKAQTVQVDPFRDPSELATVVLFAPVSAIAKRRARLP